MTPSPIRRLRSAAVALTLTAAATGTAVAAAGPAHAVSNDCQTTTSITVNGSTADQAIKYGTSVTVVASVAVGACQFSEGVPTRVEDGTLRIEKTLDQGTTWTTVASLDVSTGSDTIAKAGISGWSFLPKRTEFRVRFTGGSDEASGDTFHDAPVDPATSYIWATPYRAAKEIASKCTTTGCTDTWKIYPAASISGLRVQLQRRSAGAWSTVARRLVSSTGTFRYTFAPGTTRVYLPAARGYAASYVTVTVSRRG